MKAINYISSFISCYNPVKEIVTLSFFLLIKLRPYQNPMRFLHFSEDICRPDMIKNV